LNCDLLEMTAAFYKEVPSGAAVHESSMTHVGIIYFAKRYFGWKAVKFLQFTE
jgi:hypothetical protein